MARTGNGQSAKRRTVEINGSVRPAAAGGVHFTIRVDGSEVSWPVPSGTAHEAVYSAAISAMMDAHADGVTHLTLQTPANLVRRQRTREWATESPALRRAGLIYELFRIDFDDVDWVKGPG